MTEHKHWVPGYRHYCGILALLFTLCFNPSHASQTPLQNYQYHTWSLADGLPQITVNGVTRDPDGRAWIATENGLARFDGNRMEVFTSANTPALKSNWINGLLRDRDDNLWISTLKNLVLYQHGEFTEVAAQSGITQMVQTDAGDLWFGGDQLWQFRQGRLHQASHWQGEVRALMAQGNTLFVADRGSRIHAITGQEITQFNLPFADSQILVNDLAWHDNHLWVASDRGLFHWQAQERGFRPFSLPMHDQSHSLAPVQAMATSTSGALLVLYADSIAQLVNGRVTGIFGRDRADALPALRSIFADTDDSFWVGSLTAGVRYFWPSPVTQLGRSAGLSEDYVWSFWQDAQSLLIGTDAGVFEWNGRQFSEHVPADWLPGGVAYSLLRDRQRQLWVGTRQGLVRVDPETETTDTFPLLHGLQINGIVQTADDTVYFATAKGLFAWRDGLIIQRFADEIGARAVRFVFEDSNRLLWIGTESGLWHQTEQGLQAANQDTAATAFVTAIAELKDGRMIVATYQDGLLVHDGERWYSLASEQGLPSTGANFVGQAGNWLWVLYTDGIYRVDIASLGPALQGSAPLNTQMVLHDTGLRQGHSRIRCCNGAGNGKGMLQGSWLWAPTLEGAVRVNVQAPQLPAPQARIHALIHAGTSLLPTPALSLEGPKRDLEIRYSAVEFQYAKSLRYRYRLHPYQTDWVYADNRSTAFYTNLPPGQFTFEVQAKYSLGNWGAASTQALDIQPHYFETWWFQSMIFALLVGLFMLGFQWRTRRLKAYQRQLQQEVALRTQELKRANKQLAQLNQNLQKTSVTDELTGLRNRRFIQQQMPSILARLKRLRENKGDNWVLGILMLDLDHFKKLNDKYGHNMGDRVLERTAKKLANIIRTEDYLLRWGGEEFLLLVPDIHQSQLPSIAERVRAAVMAAKGDLEIEEPVSASIGCVRHPLVPTDQPLENWQASLAAADFALYGAKNAGRNRCGLINFNANGHYSLTGNVGSETLDEWQRTGLIKLKILGA
ncbi:ligand-binding sensor domain-containing diguanylate cyclase [Simiduia aestuariiviva]|uniref:diguanylate cyclase n=1 Tax=Simiduia aestuariiviva TaxID=1510459 RepID=A0A839UJC4_9GAMM|nr:ligand-binding sensor domain-containing diguanylate cyclase [Simiduia aestuariiviva]MBB3167673.1 diguanylate cyclase (GGDEF)-like protein [Simiduia aestuariiviva]